MAAVNVCNMLPGKMESIFIYRFKGTREKQFNKVLTLFTLYLKEGNY